MAEINLFDLLFETYEKVDLPCVKHIFRFKKGAIRTNRTFLYFGLIIFCIFF